MLYTSTRKQLILHLTSSVVMSFITILQLAINMAADRPGWLIALLCIPVPIFAWLAIVIAIDLNRQDFETVRGVLIEKYSIANGWKIRVQVSERTKPYTFRMNNQFDQSLSGIELERPIVVTCYKLTRAVHSLESGDSQGGQLESTQLEKD